MNQLNELIDGLLGVIGTAYGGVFAIIIFAFIMIFTIITLLLPLFVWGIHNQTTRATKELIKLNKKIESLKPQQRLEELAEQPSRDSRTEKMVEEIFKENQIESPSKDKLPEIPTQAFKRRKVFRKPEDELRDQKKKTG